MCLKYGNRLYKDFVKIFNFFGKFRIFVRYTLSPVFIPSGTFPRYRRVLPSVVLRLMFTKSILTFQIIGMLIQLFRECVI